jgi:hypothetical protein
MTPVNGSMRYQDSFDTGLPRRAHQSSGAQHPPWDREDTAFNDNSAFDANGGFRPSAAYGNDAYGNDAFDNGSLGDDAYRGGGYGGGEYGGGGGGFGGGAYGQYGNRGTGGFQARADDFDAFGGTPSRRGTGGFEAIGARYPSAADATSVDEFTAIDGRLYGVTDDDPGRHRGDGPERVSRSRGLLAGGVSGFLAAGTAIGMANLAAAFIRPQASPIIAVGGWFIDHTPPALKEFAIEKFGENDKNMLLLGMYVTIALIAVVIGMIAWRHFSVGIVFIAGFGAFGAYIAYTRPESRVTDVIPALIGGVLGMAVLALLNLWTTRREQPPASPSSAPRGAYRSGWAA